MVHVIRADTVCVLCHEEVEPYRPEVALRRTPTDRPWLESLICWLDSSPIHEWPPRPQWFTVPVDLTTREWTTHYRLIDRWTKQYGNTPLCRDGDDCKRCCLQRRANLAHITCIKTAFTRIPDLTIATLAQIAIMTSPIAERYHMSTTMGTPRILQSLPPASALADTELARLINLIRARLPPELHRVIARHVSGGFYRNQAACVAILDNVVPKLQKELPQRDRAPSCPLAHCETIEKLGINKVNIMGEMCATLVGADNSIVYDDEIRVDPQKVSALEVAFGRFGIIGLRLHYSDHTSSSWLGGKYQNKFATYPGTDLRLIQTASDGHRLSLLDLLGSTALEEL